MSEQMNKDVFNVKDHLKHANTTTQELFENIESMIKGFSNDVNETATKYEVRFKTKKVFAAMRIGKKKIKCWIRIGPENFQDPKGIVKTMKWSPPYFFYIDSIDDVAYALSLIRQAYEFSKK